MANITCSACQEALIWYSAGQLPQDERQPIARHLETCAACQHELTQWQALGEEMRRTRAMLTPPHRAQIWQGIQEQIASHLPSSTLQGVEHMEFEQQPPALLPATPVSIERARRPQWLALVASILVVALAVGIFALRGNVRFGGGPDSGERLLSNTYTGMLVEVAMVSPNEGWAISQTANKDNCNATSGLLHYHGGSWWEVALPSKNLHCSITLNTIVMVSPDEGWIMGGTEVASTNAIPAGGCLFWHYLNGVWRDVPVSDCAGGPVSARAFAPNNIWTVGSVEPLNPSANLYPTEGVHGGMTLIMHYDGHVWRRMASPAFNVNAAQIWGGSPDNVTIFGYENSNDIHTVGQIKVLHYDGQMWTQSPNFSDGGKVIGQIVTSSPNEGWAVGATIDNAYINVTGEIVVQYHNGNWQQPIKIADTNHYPHLVGIAMLSPDEGWAVGDQIVHYLHGMWTPVVTSLPQDQDLASVAMVSPTEGWAVGYSHGGDNPLIMHYINGTWTVYLATPGGATTVPNG